MVPANSTALIADPKVRGAVIAQMVARGDNALTAGEMALLARYPDLAATAAHAAIANPTATSLRANPAVQAEIQSHGLYFQLGNQTGTDTPQAANTVKPVEKKVFSKKE